MTHFAPIWQFLIFSTRNSAHFEHFSFSEWHKEASAEFIFDFEMTDFEEGSSEKESEKHIWTNVAERPTGEDMDTQRKQMVSLI